MSQYRYTVAVVIPAYRQTAYLKKAVESLLRVDFPPERWEAIVVDSSPTDENLKVVEAVAQAAPFRLRCVRKKPEGPGPSRNLGVKLTDSQFIAFLDSDCEATPEWLNEGLGAFGEGIGIVQGRTLPSRDGVITSRTWYLRVEHETPYYETANVFYRRAAFEQTRGFPADMYPEHTKPMGGEDVVAAWTVIRLGWKTRFTPAALVYHALVPIPAWRMVFVRHWYVKPWLVRQFPELRRYLYLGCFLDRYQAMITLGLLGAAAALAFHPAGWLLVAPYLLVRLAEPGGRMKGIRKPLRLLSHGTRDLSTFAVLLAGSLRYRSIVL